MTFPRDLFRFFIYSNIFIGCCAVLMVEQTAQILLEHQPPVNFFYFVFFATLCSYSFHWYLTPPEVESASSRIDWQRKYRSAHLVFFMIGVIGAGITAFHLLRFWPWLLLSAFVTFLYSAPKIPNPIFRWLRKIAIGKTIFLAFVWMHVTTILPLVISGEPWKASFTLFSVARFFLIYAICIIFDRRDREYDVSVGIKSLITWLDEQAIVKVFVVSLIIFAGSTLALLNLNYSIALIFFLIIPAIIVAALYKYTSTHNNDILYYFVLDGLMALSAMLTLMFSVGK